MIDLCSYLSKNVALIDSDNKQWKGLVFPSMTLLKTTKQRILSL